MFLDPVVTQQVSKDILILLFEETSDNIKYIKIWGGFVSDFGKVGKIPQNYRIIHTPLVCST